MVDRSLMEKKTDISTSCLPKPRLNSLVYGFPCHYFLQVFSSWVALLHLTCGRWTWNGKPYLLRIDFRVCWGRGQPCRRRFSQSVFRPTALPSDGNRIGRRWFGSVSVWILAKALCYAVHLEGMVSGCTMSHFMPIFVA